MGTKGQDLIHLIESYNQSPRIKKSLEDFRDKEIIRFRFERYTEAGFREKIDPHFIIDHKQRGDVREFRTYLYINHD